MEHESSFLYVPVNALWHSVQHQYAWDILDHVIMAALVLLPLMFVIEIMANFARILSLRMRLFGNIFGGHPATGICSGLVPVIIPLPMMALGIFGAVLQTFGFIVLTMVYLGGDGAAEA